METSAKIVLDSMCPRGHRITTYELIYPRIIHAEVLTHRLFSKNSASSRAIPFNKMVESVQNNGFIPIAFQKSHSGMQGNGYLEGEELEDAISRWEIARDSAIYNAEGLYNIEVTKQLCNRLLEPFSYIKVLLTATEYANFFELRAPIYQDIYDKSKFHKSWKDNLRSIEDTQTYNYAAQYDTVAKLYDNKGMAEIHLMDLAEKMWDALNESKPQKLKNGEWHIPYGDKVSETDILIHVDEYNTAENQSDLILNTKLGITAMMQARTSYTVPDKEQAEWTIKKYLEKFTDMTENGHWSPMEHNSQVMTDEEYENDFDRGDKAIKVSDTEMDYSKSMGWCNNFRGFKQLRWMMEHKQIEL